MGLLHDLGHFGSAARAEEGNALGDGHMVAILLLEVLISDIKRDALEIIMEGHFAIEKDGLDAIFVSDKWFNDTAIGFFVSEFAVWARSFLLIVIDSVADIFEAGEEAFVL